MHLHALLREDLRHFELALLISSLALARVAAGVDEIWVVYCKKANGTLSVSRTWSESHRPPGPIQIISTCSLQSEKPKLDYNQGKLVISTSW